VFPELLIIIVAGLFYLKVYVTIDICFVLHAKWMKYLDSHVNELHCVALNLELILYYLDNVKRVIPENLTGTMFVFEFSQTFHLLIHNYYVLVISY
jgi:hypothetical protein